ncbi:bifunctional glutamate N-acetyltransferase/amino-acid acetyltransferase ArgJ [Fictibacillus sp. Mic-4]|uniref:bifunctional glutamate N-acetyltransferase/amino-acid acetyltransferase ArgJ n=1 Tax=Fictibacillus sp. Mic-4 TaxID=3132826 RepID=UPI003CF627CA
MIDHSVTTIKKVTDKNIASPIGFSACGIHCGIKHKKKDLSLIYSEKPAAAAAVYTTNKIQAAPLEVTRKSIETEGKLQAILVNSGNANACTGKIGLLNAYEMRQAVSERFQIDEHLVAVASTGVIGELLPMENILKGIEELAPEATLQGSIDFSQAILTTDTVSKNTCYQFQVDGKDVTIAGTAKGSGMVHPNMATMLAFITTDAVISHENLQAALKQITDETFNSITIDGDTSTNDMVIVMANGMAEHKELTPEHPDFPVFIEALKMVSTDLAKAIASDGEGATKLIEVEVKGARSDEEARKVAKTIVGSPLVKTAAFGCDANWGRIICAIGYSGAQIDPKTIDISIGKTPVLAASEIQAYSEEEVTQYLKGNEIKIEVDLHLSTGKGKAWGCDLTYDYVHINGSYRT